MMIYIYLNSLILFLQKLLLKCTGTTNGKGKYSTALLKIYILNVSSIDFTHNHDKYINTFTAITAKPTD